MAGPEPNQTNDANLPLMPGFREMAVRRRQLATELVELRRAAGLSQTQLAARMGTSQSAIARLEAGDADIRLSTLERYAAALGQRLQVKLRPTPREPREPRERRNP